MRRVASILMALLTACGPERVESSTIPRLVETKPAIQEWQPTEAFVVRNELQALPSCNSMQSNCLTARVPSLCEFSQEKCDVARQSQIHWPSPFDGVEVLRSEIKIVEATHSTNLKLFVVEAPCENTWQVALNGWSEDGHPILLSEEGEIEVVAPGDFDFLWDKQVVDRASGQVIERYLVPTDFPGDFGFHFKPDGSVYVSSIGNQCMMAIKFSGSRLQTVSDDHCSDIARVGKNMNRHRDTGIERPTEKDILIARRAFEALSSSDPEWFDQRVHRISGRNELLVDLVETCT